MRVLSIHGTPNRLSGPEDLLDGSGEVLGEGFVGHFACNLRAGGGEISGLAR